MASNRERFARRFQAFQSFIASMTVKIRDSYFIAVQGGPYKVLERKGICILLSK